MAGTSHADVHLLGPISSTIDCGVPINNGPMHLVAKAAFRGLDTWVATGIAPPTAPLLGLTSDAPLSLSRSDDGIALGGVRTPSVDVPVDVHSGVPGPNPALLCLLLGSTSPLPSSRLAVRYGSRADYLQLYRSDADTTIRGGFVLEADRQTLLGFAAPSRVSG